MLYFPRELPGWFTLDWDPALPGIIVGLRKELQKEHRILTSGFTEAYEEYLERRYRGIPLFQPARFIPLTEEKCGFDGCMRLIGVEGAFARFSMTLPRARVFLEERCEQCGGSGESEYRSDCMDCDGSGKKNTVRWSELYLWSTTLAVLTTHFGCVSPKKLPPLNASQHVFVQTCLREENMDGAPLEASISPRAAEWVARQGGELKEIIQNAMLKARNHLWQEKRRNARECYVNFYPSEHSLILRSGGATLGTLGERSPKDRLQYLVPHNTDGPLDQAILVCGFSALSSAITRGLMADA